MFQVAIGDATSRVVDGHELRLDVFREGKSPDVTLARVVEVHAAHTSLGGIGGTQEGRLLGHDLGKVSGAVAEASS